MSAPHPTGSEWSVATRNRPAGGRSSCTSPECSGRVEARLEAAAELADVRVRHACASGAGGVDDLDPDERGREKPLDLAHRGDELLPLPRAERSEQRSGEVVAAALEGTPLAAAARREMRGADAPVCGARADRDQPVALERLQQPAEVAGVELEPGAEVAHVCAVLADLPQHARLAERAVT